MVPYATSSLGKSNKFRFKMYLRYVHSIIQEKLQKILNKKTITNEGRHE